MGLHRRPLHLRPDDLDAHTESLRRAVQKVDPQAPFLDQGDGSVMKESDHQPGESRAAAQVYPACGRRWRESDELGRIDDMTGPHVIKARLRNKVMPRGLGSQQRYE